MAGSVYGRATIGSARFDHAGPQRLEDETVMMNAPPRALGHTVFSSPGQLELAKTSRHPPDASPRERAMLSASSARPPGNDSQPPASSEAGGSP